MERAVEGFDHDVLERLEVGVLAQEVHPAHRSVQGMVHLPIWCFSRSTWHVKQGVEERPPPILAASAFPVPKVCHREAARPREAAPQTEQSSRLSEVS